MLQQQQQQQQLLLLQQSQMLPQQQGQQLFALSGVNQTAPNNLKVVNQLATSTKQNMQPHETADSGSESEQVSISDHHVGLG